MTTGRLRRYAALAAVACVLASAPAVATSAPHGLLVLSGSRSAHQDVTFASRMTFDAAGEGIRYDTHGSYAGFYLEPLTGDRADGVGQVRPAAFGEAGFPSLGLPLGRRQVGALLTSPVTVPAGRYRVHLIADGATVVTVPVVGIAGKRVVRPTTPTTVSVRVSDVTPRPGGVGNVPGFASFTGAVSVGSRTIAISAIHVLREGTTAAAQAVYTGCIEADPVPVCRSNGDTYFDSTGHYPSNSTAFTESVCSAAYYFPGDAPPGIDTAQASVTTPSTLRSVIGLAFAIGL
ncbi:MAG: hypothetical protein QOE45_493 [Frankiaceae bacterium]|jgi:hypothetical protein|nr:hypothetical protein [Frankiaceae bacterium]